MKILITGGLGFIGYHLTKKLDELEHEVHVVDNFTNREYCEKNSLELSKLSNVSVYEKDLVTDDLSSLDDDFDFVVHLAALPRVQYSFDNLVKTTTVNCVSTAKIVEFCKRIDAPLVFSSSSTAIKEMSPYGSQKAYAENIIKQNLEKYYILRLFSVYGKNMNTTGDYTLLIPELITCALTGRTFNLYGDGTVKRAFTYVDDVVDKFLFVMSEKKTNQRTLYPSGTYNVGRDISESVMRVLKIVQTQTGKKINVHFHPARTEEAITKVDSTDNMLFKCDTNLIRGIYKIIGDYRND